MNPLFKLLTLFVLLFVPFFALSSLTGCKKSAPAAVPSTSAAAAVEVKGVPVDIRDVTLQYSFTGRTVPVSKVEIVPRIRGFLQSKEYTEGTIVEPGQLLFQIQDFDYQIALEKAKSQLAASQAKENSAKATYESAIKTNAQVPGTVSENDIVIYKAKWDEAKANVYNDYAQYKYAVQQLSYTKITSPLKGKISKENYYVGDLLDGTAGSPPVLCTVICMDPIYVEFQVSDRQFDKALEAAHKQKNAAGQGGAAGQAGAGQTGAATQPGSPNGASSPVAGSSKQSEEGKAPVSGTPDGQTPANAQDADANGNANGNGNVVLNSLEKEPIKPYTPQNEYQDVSQEPAESTVYMKVEKKNEGGPIKFWVKLNSGDDSPVFEGTLNYNDNQIDMATGTMTIRGSIANPDYQIYPGHICTVTLEGHLIPGASVIQERAICNDLTSRFVWVVDENQTVSKRYIDPQEQLPGGQERIIAPYTETQVSGVDGSTSVVKSGLKAGEVYLVEGFQRVRSGSKVSVK